MAQHSSEVSVIVAETIADVSETSIEDLPPLATVIDLDALDTLVSSTETDPSCDLTVSFTYDGLRVVVASNKIIYTEPVSHRGTGPLENRSA